MGLDFDRRRLLVLGAAVVGGGLLGTRILSSRDEIAPAGASGGGGAPRPGGEIYYLNAFLNAGWAPSQIGSWHALQVWNLIGEYLFYVNLQNELTGHLATGYTADDDFTRFTFALRDDVTFSNGRKLDAEAVALNLDLFGLGDETRGIPKVANIPPSYRRTVATAEHEVVVELDEPFPGFVWQLAGSSNVAILAPETIGLPLEQQSDLDNVHGTGPWVPESWVASKEVVLRRREDYAWPREEELHEGPAYLERITVRQVDQDLLRVGALESGQAHLIHYTQPSAEDRLAAAGHTIVDTFASGSVWCLHIRVNSRFGDDVRVREALNRATDRQQVVDTFYNDRWKVAQSPVNRATPWGLDLSERFAHDRGRADELLDEAGWTGRDGDGYRVKDGRTLEFVVYPSVFITTSRDALTLLTQQWRSVGVKLTLRNVDYSNYNTTTLANNPDPVQLYEIHWGASHPANLWRWWHSSQGNQFGAPAPELDDLLEQIAQARTEDEAYEHARQALTFVVDHHYFIPVHEFPQNFAAAAQLKGVTTDGYPKLRLYDAWLDV